MMKKTKLVQLTGLIVLFFIAMMSCNQESAKSDAAAIEELTKIGQSYQNDFNNKDAAAVSMLFTEDGSQLPPGADMIIGRGNIEKFLQPALDSGIVNLQIEAISNEIKGNFGYGVGKFKYDFPAKDSSMMTVIGKYVTIFEKAPDGKWHIKYHMYNYDAAPVAASAPKDSM